VKSPCTFRGEKVRPQILGALGLSNHFSGFITVVSLRGGSRATGGLSARGLANVAVRDWSDNFIFIVGHRHYQCPSSLTKFLSPWVTRLHSVDDTIDEMKIDVEDPDELFGAVLEAVRQHSGRFRAPADVDGDLRCSGEFRVF
jgi:hypothetical protein